MAGGADFTFLEFFAGGGMAALGLGARWRPVFANDFDPMKRAAYGANFGLEHHVAGDIHALTLADLPAEQADLAWASSPCQDLSLAGARGGLGARRSGAFFGFWRLVEALDDEGRAPRLVVVENVAGLLTSNGGADFARVVEMMAARRYLVSALLLNAADFVPQSRPRLFIVAARAADAAIFSRVEPPSVPAALAGAVENLSHQARRSWRWIAAAPVCRRNLSLADILDGTAAFDPARTTRERLSQMTPRQRAAIRELQSSGARHVGAAFRRVRIEDGEKRLRIEARFDGLAGCVRTAAGGSSRQIIFEIDRGKIRSRLMTAREAARAMGLPEAYILPAGATAALKLVGDGVAPPVVSWLAGNVLEPMLVRAQKAA
ncbi:MAG: DNA cytosine methyltransferase [Pseudomonadota bacterium]